MPVRVQRKRVKGWKMPENTISVTRPGKYGNPFKIVGDMIYLDISFRRKLMIRNGKFWCQCSIDKIQNKAVELFSQLFNEFKTSHDNDILYWVDYFEKLDMSELKARNLACFCSLDKTCHADELLKIVNG